MDSGLYKVRSVSCFFGLLLLLFSNGTNTETLCCRCCNTNRCRVGFVSTLLPDHYGPRAHFRSSVMAAMAVAKRAVKCTMQFCREQIAVQSGLIRDIYKYALTGEDRVIYNMWVYDMKVCFQTDGFMDEFAECMYNVRDRLRRYPETLHTLYVQFMHWLDSDYSDPAMAVDQDTIRKRLFIGQLSAYCHWCEKAERVFSDIMCAILNRGPPALYNAMYKMIESMRRNQFQMSTVGDAFMAFLCLVRPANGDDGKGNLVWQAVCRHADLFTIFLPPDSVYFYGLDKPFTKEEQTHTREAFGAMGLDEDTHPSMYGGPDRSWMTTRHQIVGGVEGYVMFREEEKDRQEKARTIVLQEALDMAYWGNTEALAEALRLCDALIEDTDDAESALAKAEHVLKARDDDDDTKPKYPEQVQLLTEALLLCNATFDNTGDIVKFWNQSSRDDEKGQDTYVGSNIADRLAHFDNAKKKMTDAWMVYDETATLLGKVADGRVFCQEYIAYYSEHKDTRHEFGVIGWCVVRLLRLHLFRSMKEQWRRILVADSTEEEKNQACRILNYIAGRIIASSSDDDALTATTFVLALFAKKLVSSPSLMAVDTM
jgi:hypothetical protein